MSQELLTLRRAAERLGWPGRAGERRLIRAVLGRERESRRRIATRLPGPYRTRLRVTMSALRRHLPELFKSKVDELADNMREFLGGIDSRIEELTATHIAEQVEPRLDELWQRDEKIAESVSELGKRVNGLAQAVRR